MHNSPFKLPSTATGQRRAWLLRHRVSLAGAGLLAVAASLAVSHRPAPSGLAADDITPEHVTRAALEADATEWSTGRYLLDFVEPEDGEGGSEQAIAAAVSRLDALADVDVEPAGFYSEGEHLYRVTASPEAWDRIDDALASDPLLEGFEPEVIYALPQREDASVSVGVLDDIGEDEVAPAKPPRFQPNDPRFTEQWHIEQISAPEAWATSKRGKGVVVAVIDTGVAWKTTSQSVKLPDLENTAFAPGQTFAAGLPDGLDDHAHGSHVAGTIAQSTNNGVGVTGVAFEATILPLKVLSKEGRGTVPAIANAVRYAADHGAHVINMSLGGPLPSRVLAKAIEYAHGKGVTTVCAAGNESRGRVGYPAANQYAIAVSATNIERELSFYSNFGSDIDVAAPGGDTRKGKAGGVLQNTISIGDPQHDDYLFFQGTSMASPHAAGVAALIVGEGITNPDEVERVLKESALHPKGAQWDKFFGAGIVDARAAVDAAKQHYAPERAGLLGLLGLLGLGGLGVASATRRRRVLAVGSAIGGAAIGSGALATTPLAYGIAGATGLHAGFTAGGLAAGTLLALSAVVPVGVSLLAMGWKPARPFLVGLGFGWAALLLHGAVVLPTLLGLPGGELVDRGFLAVNAGLVLWFASRLSRLK